MERAEQIRRAQAGEVGSDLVAVGGTAEQRAVALRETRTEIERIRASIEQRAAEMQQQLDQMLEKANAQLAPLQEQTALLTEGIHAVELFLGSNEGIYAIREGEPAPAGTTITVRQLVLGMDEECAFVALDDEAEYGGITARSIDDFTDWLLASPAHLDQVLPEPKGVVALRPVGDPNAHRRRRDRLNPDDLATYLLIRNGGNLYLHKPDEFQAGETLVPRMDQFDQFFMKDEYDHATGDRRRVRMVPGTYEWERAEKEASGERRHYLKAALILEGLLHRTAVFHPVPEGASFVEGDSYDAGFTRVIMDADRALGHNRETYEEWRSRLAAELRPGMRVIGDFSWGSDWQGMVGEYERQRFEHPRVSPPRAEAPTTGEIYMIEERRPNGDLVIRYGKGRTIYTDDGAKPAQRRVSAVLRPTDEFVLPFDLIDPADVERFMKSRLERRRYLAMFPLLAAIRERKAEEAIIEAPFRQLLVAHLAATNGVEFDTVEAELDDLIDWYKARRRDHRPLVGTSHEAQAEALDVITTEHAKRLADRARPVKAELVEKLAAMPDCLLVARKRDGKYVTLTATEGSDRYVTVTEYGVRGAQSGEARPWLIVGNRTHSWQILWTAGERWKGWPRFASRLDVPTRPDIEQAVAQLAEHTEAPDHWGGRDDTFGGLLAITYEPNKGRFETWYQEIPSDPNREIRMRCQAYSWSVRQNGTVNLEQGWYDAASATYVAGVVAEFEATRWHPGRQVLATYPDEIAAADERAVDHNAWVAKEKAIQAAHQALRAAFRERMEVDWLAAAEERMRQKFLATYGDASLWPGHRKALRDPVFNNGDWWGITEAVERTGDAIESLRGRTVDEIAAKYELVVPEGFEGLVWSDEPIPDDEEEADDDEA